MGTRTYCYRDVLLYSTLITLSTVPKTEHSTAPFPLPFPSLPHDPQPRQRLPSQPLDEVARSPMKPHHHAQHNPHCLTATPSSYSSTPCIQSTLPSSTPIKNSPNPSSTVTCNHTHHQIANNDDVSRANPRSRAQSHTALGPWHTNTQGTRHCPTAHWMTLPSIPNPQHHKRA